jgi:hypothetical protein
MTTAHGGFYINCGALEFKEISDQSDAEELKELKTKKRLKVRSDFVLFICLLLIEILKPVYDFSIILQFLY